jgi:hypothetical protein
MQGELLFIDTDVQQKIGELKAALISVDDEETGPARETVRQVAL